MQIPDFPSDLGHLHHAWHMPWEHPELPTRLHPMGSPGGGREFLAFHRDFMTVVLDWYRNHQFTEDPFNDPTEKMSLVTPWSLVPIEMQNLDKNWNVDWAPDVARLDPNPKNPPAAPEFIDDDEIGFFIESRIHNNFLHGAAATAFHDETVRPPGSSPNSTLFYKIHGLVQHWWSLWARRTVFKGKATFDPNKPVPQRPPTFGRGSTVLDPNRPVPSRSNLSSMHQENVQQIVSLNARVRLLEERTFPLAFATFGMKQRTDGSNKDSKRRSSKSRKKNRAQ